LASLRLSPDCEEWTLPKQTPATANLMHSKQATLVSIQGQFLAHGAISRESLQLQYFLATVQSWETTVLSLESNSFLYEIPTVLYGRACLSHHAFRDAIRGVAADACY
jgi:hypothetical protein